MMVGLTASPLCYRTLLALKHPCDPSSFCHLINDCTPCVCGDCVANDTSPTLFLSSFYVNSFVFFLHCFIPVKLPKPRAILKSTPAPTFLLEQRVTTSPEYLALALKVTTSTPVLLRSSKRLFLLDCSRRVRPDSHGPPRIHKQTPADNQ